MMINYRHENKYILVKKLMLLINNEQIYLEVVV